MNYHFTFYNNLQLRTLWIRCKSEQCNTLHILSNMWGILTLLQILNKLCQTMKLLIVSGFFLCHNVSNRNTWYFSSALLPSTTLLKSGLKCWNRINLDVKRYRSQISPINVVWSDLDANWTWFINGWRHLMLAREELNCGLV